ncbi:MAG: hypothetical protein ACRCS8_02360 [Brevinema sp.]
MKKILTNLFLSVILIASIVEAQIVPYTQQHRRSLDLMEKIRGYSFGERSSYIISQEEQKRELRINASQTNANRLVYQGRMFEEDMKVIFSFRQNRLSGLSYLWTFDHTNAYFSNRIFTLINQKYGKAITNNLPSAGGSLNISTYYRELVLTNESNKILTNTNLTIQVETIIQSNEQILIEDETETTNYKVSTTYILDFMPMDADFIINKKILSEDL